MTSSTDDPLENVLDRAIEDTDGDKVTFGDLLDLFGHRSFGPVVAFLGLLVVIPPLGAIPGLPAVIGVVIILFSVQIVLGADHIWVPGFIENRSIEKKKLEEAEDRTKKWLKRIDRMISERLGFLTGPWATYIAAIIVTILAALMIPLELVPFAVAAPGLAITIFGLAFVARDGVLMLIGYILAAIAAGLTVFMVPWGTFAGWFGA
ncbi:exopolysaccharide biosynthesis protein [Henriciella sp. AS95]|uniref:exopolysaccharide biosynthesis protein n=1 Tax=Henriciella sp. AS95 TaxID=3135782 RepID=UPI00316EEC2C